VEDGSKKDAKEFKESTSSTIGGKTTSGLDDRTIRPRVGRPRIFGKKGNMKIKKQLQSKNTEKLQKMRSKSVKLRNVALEMKNDANNEMFSPKNTPKNAKVISKLNNDICFDSKKIVSTISGVKNKTKLTLSAPKRKRPIDPVASLNASIKAKSQLRTQDGKFARNPNKDSSTKLLDNKINNGKSKNTDLIDDKSKLKMLQKLKKTEVQSPRRVTRLSSDSDNMPTLEPVVQIVSSNEEYTDKSVNDLPILSPVMSSSMSLQEQKISRTFTKYALKEKEGNIETQMEKDIEKRLVKTAFVPDIPSEVKKLLFSFTDEEEDVLNTLEVISNDTGPRRSLRQSAPRLKANDENLRESDDELNNLKSINNIDFEIVSKNNLKEQKSVKVKKLKEKVKDVAKQKEDINEENRISKTNSMILKEGRAKSKKNFSINNINNAEEISKTETVISKKDPKMKKEEAKETRSNSKIRLEKDSEKEVIKLPDVPFEVKKLLFSFTSEEEDVLSVLEVISNDSGPRRSLRQSAPKLKTNDETLQLDDELDGLKNTSKKKKIEAFKKSFRKNINEKKNINDIIKTSSENDVANNEGQNEKNHSNKKDNRASAKEIKIDNLNIMEDKINVKGELSLEGEGDNLRKSNGISEKCRGRNRSVDRETEKTNMCAMEKQDCIANEVCNEKKTDRQIEETVDKANNKSESDDETDSNSDDRSDAAMINLNLSHLQSETSNLSIDSGKENSLETSVNVHSKLKLTRLKKTWGTRRERSSRKRSLSNVIGILTEGMNSKNIPVETQQNVQILTVQTSLDNSDRVMCNGNAQQPTISDADNMIAVDTTFSELSSVVARNEEGSTEDEVITTMNAIANVSHRMDEKNITQPCSKTQDENVFTSQNIDMSSNVVKTRIPSTDIILDLSRRKPKGKGSFLEKIVSKIAKQKDALFEGEVGSLLDTAADELTSILDEVGPTLADNADSVNFDRTSYVSKDDNSENVMNTSTNKETLTIADSKIQALEDSKIIVEDIIFERTMDLETQDNVEENSILEKTKRHIQNENDVNCVLEKESLIEESQICKNKSAMKKEMAIVAPLKITNASQLSMTDISMENNSLDLIQKTNSRDTENTKSKKKSRKRSLEDATSFKKSKKRLIKIDEEHVKDNTTPKELQFDDIIASIHESEDISKKFIQKENEAIKISNVDIGNEKIQSSLKKSVKNDLELTKSERDLEGNCNRLNLKKLAYLSKTVCNIAKKSTANTEDSIREVKIIVNASKERTDVQLKESIENVKSSLFAEKDIKHKKSMDETQTDKAIDMKELMSRRVSKRKSQHVKNTPRIFVRPIDELKEVSSLSVTGDELLKLSDEELMKVNIIDEDREETEENTSLKRSLLQATSTQYEETQKIDSSSFVDSISSKTTKKRNAKKKSLADEHLELPENESTKIAPKSNEKSRSYMTNSNERLSVSLEHFKIPEMTNMLQNAKKRYTKKKSLSENGHWNNEGLSAEHRTSEESIEIRYQKISNLIERIEEQEEETEKIAIDEQSRNRRKLERSNSSDLIGLVSSPVQTKSTLKKKTQLSNDDFANSNMQFHQNAESTDDLSESSCTSEYSYFRKKRFAKKKKREEKNSNITNMRTINSPIVDPEIKTDKIKSLLDEHLDLSDSDDIDIPIDIQTSLENTKAFENIEREFELTEKSLNSQNKEKLLTDDSMNKNLSSTTERITSNNYDGLDDPIASKKRAADNFVVVHTKTGEILIVEKRKKLTKEMAKFFCDVCATSFTRKSSLKKHTLSQSHLSQVAKSKDKVELTDNSASTNEESKDWKNYETNNREADDVLENIQCDNLIQKSLELNKYASYVNSVDERQMTNSLVSFEVNRQETLEDKLLDEEICKITENMSHDEYVLTDQLTPEQPISSSTPINPAQEKQENSVQNKNEKKRNKLKKRNLADEHLILDSPEIEKFKVKEFPHVNNVNNVSVMSLEYSSTEKITKTVEKMKEVIKEIQSLNTVETNNQTISNLKFLNEETDSSKLSACEVDMKFEQHKESARTTRSTLRKLTKMNNEGKEENEISTEMNRFGLRPRKSKNFIQHYTESDIENYVYFIDISEELNDEMENICDMQKVQNTAKKETNEDTSQEKLDTENKDTKDRKSKPDSTHDIKKRKRGRPKLKNRIIANSNIISVYEEFKIKENSSVTATAFEESKVKNQKLDMCIKEMQPTDTVVLPPKRSRGRPRKNPVQTASNSTVQADNSNVSESIKPNCNETKEKIEQIEPCSDTIIEKISSTNLITSLTLNTESLSVVEDYALESNLLETKKNPSHVEEIPCIDLNASKNQSIQEIESTNIKTTDNIHAKDYNTLSLKALPEKEKDDFFLPLEINMPAKDVEYVSEKKSTHDTNVNISDHLLSQITENTSIIMDNPKLIERETITRDENETHKIEIQKPVDISELSEEKQTKLEEKILVENEILEAIHKEMELSSKKENEILITDDKTIRITDSYNLLPQQKNDLENDNDEKILLESPSKKSSKSSSQFISKERDNDHKKSKTFKDKRRKVATSKISELSSDSENENRIESASSNKSKIVKSVFGRVFGCEKADKVKEVLNDWVSRSEDDSTDDVSRNASEAFCLRGSTKISENGYKKHYSSSNMKNIERSSRKKDSDKSNNIGIHGKSKNRKKQEKDPDSISEDRIKLPSLIHITKRKSRESKIRADERILRTFDDESLIVSENENIDEIEETESQFENDSLNEKDKESKKYQEEEWNEEQTKNKNAISKNCEDLQAKHEAHGKSKNSSSYRKRQNVNTQDEHSSSSSQFNMFKYRRRESKTKAGEKIWRTFDNKTLSYLPDERNVEKTHEMEETEFYKAGEINHLNDSKHVKQTDGDTLNTLVLEENQDQAQIDSEKNRKDLSSHKKEDFDAPSNGLISIVNAFTDKHKISKKKMEKIPKDFKHTIITENIQEKNDQTQDNFESFVYDISKSINQGHNLSTKLDQPKISVKISKRDKKEDTNENWKHSTRNLKFDQKDVTEDNQLEKDRLKNKKSQRNCNSPADERLMLKNISEENSQTVPGSDNDGNDKKEEEEDDENSDNDVGKRRMSPLYARETPNSSIESSSNNEEEEEEDGEEEEEEQITPEDNSRKTISNEFSGEKIIIRSPSSGHGSDVVTIAPTDAIEDNALDVPREIESTTESRQGKILNFDEELFVECCSRLKATSENELRGAKKIKLDHTESYHRKDDQSQGFKINKDRWRDVESQNSLGSLLESVNQVSIRF